MNSSLLQNQSEDYLESNNILNSDFFLNNNSPIFQNDNNEEESFLFLKDEKNEQNCPFTKQLYLFEKPEFLNEKINESLIPISNNEISEKDQKNDIYEEQNKMNNIGENSSCFNLPPLSMLTTSNSNIVNSIGVKNNDFILDSNKDSKSFQNENLNDTTFKCDFLEKISLGLDENEVSYYYNNKKNRIDLNNSTSLLASIINLMKEKGPIDVKTIVSCLENKKDTFRKANGSKYKQDFNKLVRITLNTPDIFYKTEEGNKFFFIEDKTAYYLKKKRERAMEKIFMNLKKKNNTSIPINIKIQLDKVNSIIKKMEKKYKGDKKYVNVMICINLFKSLIKKYLYLVKMEKINSLFELTVLNDKIIDICHTLEKIEKGEIFFTANQNFIIKKANEYNSQNNKDIMFVDGQNNHFNEPPNIIE